MMETDERAYLSAEEIAERWPVAGDCLGRWRDQLRRWRCAPSPLLRVWKDFRVDSDNISPGRYPYAYRVKRIVYLLLTEQTAITSELRQQRMDDLRADYNRLLQTAAPHNSDNADNP